MLVPDPEISHGIDPAHGHGLDIRALLGDMSILGGIVLADDEVGNVRGQVVLVDAAELVRLLCYCCLRAGKVDKVSLGRQGVVNKAEHCAAGLTRRSVGMLVQQTTTPAKGWEWSKASSPWSEDAGGESMTLVASDWNCYPCKGMGLVGIG